MSDQVMAAEIVPATRHSTGIVARPWFETAGFWLLIATLAWTPFPLGSNRAWSWSVLVLLVATCWCLFLFPTANDQERIHSLGRLRVPLIFAGVALGWAVIQASPFIPGSWSHPVWQLGESILRRPLHHVISVDPWRTVTEAMKLGAYISAAALAYMWSLHTESARRLLNALVLIGAAYAAYGLVLGAIGITQEQVFYTTRPTSVTFAGPFVSRNNFATYAGLCVLCASISLCDCGARTLIIGRGARAFILSAISFLFGRGAVPAVAFLLAFSTLVASGSRAGFIACLVGIAALIGFGAIVVGRTRTKGWAVIGTGLLVLAILGIFLINGDNLENRFDALADAGAVDQTRVMLWQAALRMIADAPWLGLGLGTYEHAYPMYADRVLPYIIDKAHNDYLELAAGLGIPAAMAWWAAILWLVGMCVRALFIRHRNRHLPLLAVAATALVGFHSFFDFSLQIPAVALFYAVILGLGVAQSRPTRQME